MKSIDEVMAKLETDLHKYVNPFQVISLRDKVRAILEQRDAEWEALVQVLDKKLDQINAAQAELHTQLKELEASCYAMSERD